MSAISCFAIDTCIYTCTKVYRCIDVDMDVDIDIDIDIDISCVCVCDGSGGVCGERESERGRERGRERERKRDRKREKFACFMRAMSCFAVVPRTIESSTRTTIRSLTTACIGLNLHRTLRSRCSCRAATSQVQPATSQDIDHPVSATSRQAARPAAQTVQCCFSARVPVRLWFLVLVRRRRLQSGLYCCFLEQIVLLVEGT